MPKRAPQFWTLLTYGLPVAIFLAVLFAQAPQYASGQKKPKIPPQAKRNSKRQSKPSSATNLQIAQTKSPFDGESAYEFLKQVVAIGPRISATQGMAKQQELITRHFEGLGATVQPQNFLAMHPHLRQQVQLSNLMVRFHPERTARILICCHYDTRPFSPIRIQKIHRAFFSAPMMEPAGWHCFANSENTYPNLKGSSESTLSFLTGKSLYL